MVVAVMVVVVVVVAVVGVVTKAAAVQMLQGERRWLQRGRSVRQMQPRPRLRLLPKQRLKPLLKQRRSGCARKRRKRRNRNDRQQRSFFRNKLQFVACFISVWLYFAWFLFVAFRRFNFNALAFLRRKHRWRLRESWRRSANNFASAM